MRVRAAVASVLLLLAAAGVAAQGAGDAAVTPAQLTAAIDALGTIEFTPRMAASRTVRRAEAALAVPALLKAIESHKDAYVRFRALVLVSGFNDPRAREVMAGALTERNDRMRAVAYAYFEHHPDPQVLPRLLEAVAKEESEFVRPALTRALAAYGKDDEVRKEMTVLVMRGQDFFRAPVIEALGDYKGAYALPALTEVAKLEGPLQDDAVLAMGKIGDKRALETFVALQRSAPRTVQPTIAAAICLLGINCGSHQGYLVETLKFAIANPGYQELLRASVHALAALAVSGRKEAAVTLVELGAPTRDPERAAIVLAIGTVALRNTTLLLEVLQERPALLQSTTELMREAFDMLEEDFEEERFFVAVRRAYWQAPEGSPARQTAQALIQRLEF